MPKGLTGKTRVRYSRWDSWGLWLRQPVTVLKFQSFLTSDISRPVSGSRGSSLASVSTGEICVHRGADTSPN